MIPNLIVPTLNRYDLLQKMLDSIDYPVEHLLVIDNGGKLKGYDVPLCVKEITTLYMPANLGVASSWNLGIKCFPFDPMWFIVSDDVVFEPGALEAWYLDSSPERVVVSDQWPFFQVMSIGENVIDKVGLFDEAFHPANFEDDDFEWRCNEQGIMVERRGIGLSHVKQGTVFHEDYRSKNQNTYPLNEEYYEFKRSVGATVAGQWSLDRRRKNSWD
jgi:GT2 family glycosyltransferase